MEARIIKRRKKSKISKIIRSVFLVTTLCFLLDKYFLKPWCVTLNRESEKIANQIVNIRQNNEKLKIEIKELTAYERVMSIAKDAGLELNNNNIVTVVER